MQRQLAVSRCHVRFGFGARRRGSQNVGVIDRPFSELVHDLAARTPAPGGGAAAGMAAAMGSALLLMVVRFARGKKANAARESELGAVEAELVALQVAILPLAQQDAASFEPVAAAYRLSQATEAEKEARRRAIATGLVGAMAVPQETVRLARQALATVLPVLDCANKSIVCDLAAGAALLRAAAEIGLLNVRINHALAGLPAGAEGLASAVAMRDDVVRHEAAVRAATDRLIEPPTGSTTLAT